MNSILLENQVIWSNVVDKIVVYLCKVIHIGRYDLNCSQAWLGFWGKKDLRIAVKGWYMN